MEYVGIPGALPTLRLCVSEEVDAGFHAREIGEENWGGLLLRESDGSQNEIAVLLAFFLYTTVRHFFLCVDDSLEGTVRDW